MDVPAATFKPAAVPLAGARSAERRAPWAGALLRALIPAIALLLVWQGLALWLKMDELPTAWEVLKTIPGILGRRSDVLSLLASLQRMILGLLLGVLLAVPAGLAMGRSERLAAFGMPLASAIYPIPKAALMPLIMLWAGVGDLSKILVIFMGVSLPLLYHSFQGARQVDEKLIWSARAMGMSRTTRLFHVVLPAALPEVLLGARVALSIALITMISSEMIARQNGAGELLFNALDMAVYTDVYAVIVIIAVFGLVIDAVFERLRQRLIHWSDSLNVEATS